MRTIMPAKDDTCIMVDRILDLIEAAEVLGIRPGTLRGWIKDGRIKAFKLGVRGLIRIREEDRQAFIDQARKGGKEKP